MGVDQLTFSSVFLACPGCARRSRAFRTRGPQHPAACLPLVDMANHSFEPNCEVLPTGEGAVAMVAKRKVRNLVHLCQLPSQRDAGSLHHCLSQQANTLLRCHG